MSGVSIDLTGETFGNLKVIRRVKTITIVSHGGFVSVSAAIHISPRGATSSLVRQNPVVVSLVAQRAQQP